MITQHRLLTSFLFLGILAMSPLSFASGDEYNCKKDVKVIDLVGDEYKFVDREIKNLKCNNTFEGRDFKIVVGTSEDAVRYDEDPKLVERAGNVYYHLTKAKNFWLTNISSAYVSNLEKLTIRIEITNAYSRTRHFKNKNLEENYNNAWSTPAGQSPRFVKEKKVWGKEIWFSPKKVIESSKEIKSTGTNPIHQSLELVKGPVWEYNKNGLIYNGLSVIADNDLLESSTFLEGVARRLGTMAIIYTASEITKHMDSFFMNKYYYIDTAMIPEIIYHEFAHVALSDTMTPLHSVPVIEGLADYFAARINNPETLYDHIEGLSLNRTKDPTNKKLYHPYYELSFNSHSDYVLGLLWKGKENFEKANAKRVGKGRDILADYDKLVYQAHFHLDEESDIIRDLTSALLGACNRVCSRKRYGHDILYRTFEQKGI